MYTCTGSYKSHPLSPFFLPARQIQRTTAPVRFYSQLFLSTWTKTTDGGQIQRTKYLLCRLVRLYSDVGYFCPRGQKQLPKRVEAYRRSRPLDLSGGPKNGRSYAHFKFITPLHFSKCPWDLKCTLSFFLLYNAYMYIS